MNSKRSSQKFQTRRTFPESQANFWQMAGKVLILDKVANYQPVTLTHKERFEGFFIDFKNNYLSGDLLIVNFKNVVFWSKTKEKVGVLNDYHIFLNFARGFVWFCRKRKCCLCNSLNIMLVLLDISFCEDKTNLYTSIVCLR